MFTSQQFERTRDLALNLAGIELSERHRDVLARRTQRLGIHSALALDTMLAAAERGDADATRRFVCLLTTKFTGFFRHPKHFIIAAEHAVRTAQRQGHARMWCAAAATGEEAYSLAIAIIQVFGAVHPPVEILATDIDAAALAAAQQGEYNDASVRALDSACRERFFCHAGDPQRWVVADDVRRLVEFREVNLVNPTWPVIGHFEVIFCRNVLMYLGAAQRDAVLTGLASMLAPDGLLMLDPTEHLGKSEQLFTPGDSGVYSLRKNYASVNCAYNSAGRVKP